MSTVAKVFELNRKGLNLPRGVEIVVVLLVPLIVLAVLGREQYFLSVVFGVLFVGLADPGGDYLNRLSRSATVGVIGALLTALGFAIGTAPWGFEVLAAFVVTLLGGLTVKFGLHRLAVAMMLNLWFIIALGLPAIFQLDRIHTPAWAQALAWLAGSALWIAFSCIMWLARGRRPQPQAVPEIPGDTSPIKLTRAMILFALIRAIALSIAVAIAFGLHLQYAIWMPIATLAAMKPSLQQSTLVAEQRLAGTLLGAALAALFLLTVSNKHALEVVIVILAALAGAIRTVNYTFFSAALAGALLIGLDLPHPSNLADEGRRVLFTFIGVGIAVVVMLLANLLQKRTPAVAPHPT